MNARQKAKYWKRKYQELASVPVRPTIVVSDRKLERLSYTTVVNDEVRIRQILENTELLNMMLNNIKNHLVERAKFYVDAFVVEDPCSCEMRFTGRLDVAVPFRDNHDIYNTHWDVMHDTNYKGHWRSET